MSYTSRLRDLAISETGFLFDPMSGATFTVNPTGACILRALRDGCDRGEIVDRLRSTFEVGRADLESDLGDFVRLLVQSGILPHDFTLDPDAPFGPPGSPAPSKKEGA